MENKFDAGGLMSKWYGVWKGETSLQKRKKGTWEKLKGLSKYQGWVS